MSPTAADRLSSRASDRAYTFGFISLLVLTSLPLLAVWGKWWEVCGPLAGDW